MAINHGWQAAGHQAQLGREAEFLAGGERESHGMTIAILQLSLFNRKQTPSRLAVSEVHVSPLDRPSWQFMEVECPFEPPKMAKHSFSSLPLGPKSSPSGCRRLKIFGRSSSKQRWEKPLTDRRLSMDGQTKGSEDSMRTFGLGPR